MNRMLTSTAPRFTRPYRRKAAGVVTMALLACLSWSPRPVLAADGDGDSSFLDLVSSSGKPHVFATEVEWLASQGITRGCNPPAGDLFCVDEVVTRGQMAAFLNRALGLPAGTKVFSDTKAHIFEADVAALAAAGITRGCNPPTNDRFCPDDPVTRGQMAAFLYRALANPENGATGPGVEPMAVTNTDLPTGRVGDAYRATLTASGGTPPYAWSATGLPEGLSLDTSTGEMRGVFGSGTEGTHTVAVTVTVPSRLVV